MKKDINLFLIASNCSTCGCPEIVISSDGIINEAIEYHDTNAYDLSSPNSASYQFWENVTYHEEIEKNNKLKLENPGGKLREKLLSIDIHSDKFSSLWKKYNGTLNQATNLNYKDLLGSYHLDSCYEDYLKKLSPVYKKVLPDGREAFLYKKKLGATWHVISTNLLHLYISNNDNIYLFLAFETNFHLSHTTGWSIRTRNF